MKKLLPILLIFLFSCSNNQKTDNKNKQVVIKDTIVRNINKETIQKEQIKDSFQYEFNCNRFEQHSIIILNGETKEIKLTEKDIKEKDLEGVEEEFYEAYIKENDLFREWNTSKEEDYWETKHYYWGIIKEDNKCLVIIYKYFILDSSENKLFLLSIDKEGKLLNTLQIGELTHYAGATQKTYSIINEKEIKIIGIMDELTGDYNKETEQNEYKKDSIVKSYKIDNWNQFILINSDTLKTKYWE